MRDPESIKEMVYFLDNDIREKGWDPQIDAAIRALNWVLEASAYEEKALRDLTNRSETERRETWIHYGGRLKDWYDIGQGGNPR